VKGKLHYDPERHARNIKHQATEFSITKSALLNERQEMLDVAYQRYHERFVRGAPKAPALPSEVWINKPVQVT
jgi:hypothetical protein